MGQERAHAVVGRRRVHMAHIFVSYSRRDADAVDRVVEHLEKEGYDLWLDRASIPGGARWQAEIATNIEAARVFLLVLSPDAVLSENVRNEVAVARVKSKRVVAVAVRETVVPSSVEFGLAGEPVISLWSDFARGLSETSERLGPPTGARMRKGGVPTSARLSGGRGLARRLAEFVRRHDSEGQRSPDRDAGRHSAPGAAADPPPPSGDVRVDSPAPKGGKPSELVAIAYAPEDALPVQAIADRLVAEGHRTTLLEAEHRRTPERAAEVVRQIESADDFVLLLSPASANSDDLAKQVAVATEKKKRIVPVLLQPSVPESKWAYAIARLPHVDCGTDFERGLRHLASTLAGERRPAADGKRTMRNLWSEAACGSVSSAVGSVIGASIVALSMQSWGGRASGQFLALAIGSMLGAVVGAWGRRPMTSSYASVFIAFLVFTTAGSFASSMAFLACFGDRDPGPFVMGAVSGLGGGLALTVFKALSDRALTRRLYAQGMLVFAEYTGIRAASHGEGGAPTAFQIVARWRDPATGKRYEFRSPYIWTSSPARFDPAEFMQMLHIPVYVDPLNPRTYRMDISSVIPLKWGYALPTSKPRSTPGPRPRHPSTSYGEDGTLSSLYVSASQHDASCTSQVLERLRSEGCAASIRPGQDESDPAQAQAERIRSADAVLVLLSSNSVADERVFEELSLAVENGKRIIPGLLEQVDVPPSVEYAIAGVQRIDLSKDLAAGLTCLRGTFSRIDSPSSHPSRGARSGPSRFRLEGSDVLLGALAWGAGAAFGAWLFGGASRSGRTWYVGPVMALAIGFVPGGLATAVFARPMTGSRQTTTMVGVLAAFAGIVFHLPGTLAMRFLVPSLPLHGGGFDELLSGPLGGVCWTAFKWVNDRRLIRRLKRTGRALTTEYVGVHKPGMKSNNQTALQLVSEWRDPRTGERHVFYSPYVWADPSNTMAISTVTVFVDPTDFRVYHVDLSFLVGHK